LAEEFGTELRVGFHYPKREQWSRRACFRQFSHCDRPWHRMAIRCQRLGPSWTRPTLCRGLCGESPYVVSVCGHWIGSVSES